MAPLAAARELLVWARFYGQGWVNEKLRDIHEGIGSQGWAWAPRMGRPFEVPPFIGIDATEADEVAVELEPVRPSRIAWIVDIES